MAAAGQVLAIGTVSNFRDGPFMSADVPNLNRVVPTRCRDELAIGTESDSFDGSTMSGEIEQFAAGERVPDFDPSIGADRYQTSLAIERHSEHRVYMAVGESMEVLSLAVPDVNRQVHARACQVLAIGTKCHLHNLVMISLKTEIRLALRVFGAVLDGPHFHQVIPTGGCQSFSTHAES